MALSDLDALLGDLEKTCQNGCTEGKKDPAEKKNRLEHRQDESLVNELDVMLSDLAAERYGVEAEANRQRAKAVIRELKANSQEIERRSCEQRPPSASESKWEYQGYGIWETTAEETPRPATRSAASTATRELDDLMSSLNSFKVTSGTAGAASSSGGSLDEMLGDLQQDLDRQGVKTTQKGVCAECRKPIIGQVVTALGKTWHAEHFVCDHCRQELGSRSFFERAGKPYCEQDYHRLFSPRCAACKEAILDRCVSALDANFHPRCFVCADCANPFGGDGFHERDSKAFCPSCFFARFAPKCGGCDRPITDSYISTLDRQWHPACFVCAECGQQFDSGNFFEHESRPYCETHYHALRGSLCASCQKPISGRCITAMSKKFHPEHFVCSFCLKSLNKGTFKERNEKPYCHDCHDRLFR